MSLSMKMHSADIMGPASCVLRVIYHWTSVCVILGTCGASAVQYCSTNTTDGNRICTVKTCSTEGLPKLPIFPDVRRCAINNTRLIELLEPCLPEITTTTEQPTTMKTTTQVPGTDITDSSTVKDFTTTNDTITHDTTLGSTQGTPLTTDLDSTAVMPTATTQDLNTDEVRTTRITTPIASTRGRILTTPMITPSTLPITTRTSSEVRSTGTHQPINSTAWPGLHNLTTEAVASSSLAASTAENSSRAGENFTTVLPPPTTQPPVGVPWKIVLIVFGCLFAVLLILSVVYFCIRKKNVTCKVHSESDLDSKSADKSLTPAIQGKLMVQRHHDRGSLVLEPVVAPQNHLPSCNASPAPCIASTHQETDTSPTPPSGGQVINTAHVPDPLVNEDSRNRTFSTGSRTIDTSILMPADTKGTSQPEPKKKKKKKKKGSKGIELASIQQQGAAYNPVQTTDKVV